MSTDINTFISLMNTITIKTFLLFGNNSGRKLLARIIKKITGINIQGYTCGRYESLDIYQKLGAQEDIILLSPNKDIIINIQINNSLNKLTIRKNHNYLKYLNRLYNDHSKKTKTKIIQICFNNYNPPNREGKLKYIIETKLKKHIIIYDVHLRGLKHLTTLIENNLYNDLVFLSSSDLIEMISLINNSTLRRKTMENLQKLSEYKPFMDLYNHEEYNKTLEMNAYKNGYSIGTQDITKKVVKEMYKNDEPISKISLYSGLSEKEIIDIIYK